MQIFEVKIPGILTTIQDSGRNGYQQYGVPVSGAMDEQSLIMANLLVGNNDIEACLEITLAGPKLKFLIDTQIAITGADLSPTINDQEVDNWKTLMVSKGDILSFDQLRSGSRSYLSIHGGIDVPIILDSKSTYVRGAFGGFYGRPLRTGDVIEGNRTTKLLTEPLTIPQGFVPHYENEIDVDVMIWPQSDHFTDKTRDRFLSNFYTITLNSDRMGYRFDGPRLTPKDSLKIITDTTPIGAVQVPTDGKPIITMKDGQTTGGYPKIAVASTPDISRLGQTKPGDKIKFSKISQSQAKSKLLNYWRILTELKKQLRKSQ
jgi:biotin-dependent carboxylase-like uncharacterized protein